MANTCVGLWDARAVVCQIAGLVRRCVLVQKRATEVRARGRRAVPPPARLTFAIAANEDDTLVRLLKNLNILNKKYPIFDFDFDGFDSRVPAYRSPYSS